ncbi:MAG: hypothetical protein WC364_11995 [Eubacteriales bacterium]|jgi:hypothetical protein
MPKRINYANRIDGIIPQGDIGALMRPEKLKEYVLKASPKDRQRLVAFLHSIYTAPELVEMLGVKRTYVTYCSQKNRDIVEASQLSRNFAIADLTERRVIQLLQKMNIDNISDEKKPQSIKYLMDSADLARGQTKPMTEDRNEDIMELVFRVKKRMGDGRKKDDAIDITGDVEVNSEETKELLK